MPATTRPEISETRRSGSPRKWRRSRRCTASSPGQSASSSTVTAASTPACARRTRAARIALRAAGSPSGPCRASNSAAGSGKPASAARPPHIVWNCRWNARVVVDRRSCACSAGQEDRNGRLPYGRASEAPHRGQVRASRASWVGKERGPRRDGAGVGDYSVELAQGAAAAAGAGRRQRGDVLVRAGEADVQVAGRGRARAAYRNADSASRGDQRPSVCRTDPSIARQRIVDSRSSLLVDYGAMAAAA